MYNTIKTPMNRIDKLKEMKEKCEDLENDIDALISLAGECENISSNLDKFLL